MHEGQIWETLQQAGHMKMDNLVAIIDYNGFSSHDPVNEVVNLEPLADKIRSFGWHVLELHNGNDMHQVADTLMLSRHLKGKPVAIVAHTTKVPASAIWKTTATGTQKPRPKNNTSRQWRSYSDESTA
jgi:transketolase